jgi:peptidoglycan hydrolase-like protein with peptidoglycan-binding domain
MIRSFALATALIVAAPTFALADYTSALQSYESGNFQAAFADFEASANSGDAAAQYMMGQMYAQGEGVTQNYVKAHMWYNMAASWGHDRANKARARLENHMTSAQIAEAQAMAEKWQPGSAGTGPVAFSVRNMQMLLNDLGYNAGVEDGIMGSRTRSAIRAYQQSRGLSADGQLTVSLFDRIAADARGTTSTPTPTQDPAGLVANIQSELRERGYDIPMVSGELDWKTRQAIQAYQSNSGIAVDGKATGNLLARLRSSQGTDQNTRAGLVLAVQTRLNDLGYNAGPEDGVFGPTTRGAVRTFQNDNGLPVTGDITDSLLQRIQQAAGESGNEDAQRTAMVKAVEQALDVRGYEVGPIDGKVTTQTTSAVRTYQSDAGLTVDGRIDGNLLTQLERGQSNLDTMTRAQLVQAIQTSLNQRGYSAGPADGVFGPSTRRAILHYQTNANLPLTGEASRQLLTHLASSDVEPGAGGIYDGPVTTQLNKDIQVELNRLGYNVGTPDGNFNERTRQGVLAYQKEVGIQQTGEPSRHLLAQLQNSYRTGATNDPNAVILGLANQFIEGLFNQ